MSTEQKVQVGFTANTDRNCGGNKRDGMSFCGLCKAHSGTASPLLIFPRALHLWSSVFMFEMISQREIQIMFINAYVSHLEVRTVP